MLPGPERAGPEAAGLRRGAALPETFDPQPVPTRHQREPVSLRRLDGERPPPRGRLCLDCPITVSHTARTRTSVRLRRS